MKWIEKLKRHTQVTDRWELFKYIGPGLLVTVGFIDPGNWATNLAAGSMFGYTLLWVITFSTLMLIIFQHNVAHLGIVTGLCLAEATTKHLPPWLSRPILVSGLLASISTSLAEIIGGAIALKMLFGLPIYIGAVIVTLVTIAMLFTNTYSKIERQIIAFVSLIGLSFLYELWVVDVDWSAALTGWVKPSFPSGSIWVIMGVLGAVVMPHNLFLHSEVIQSRQWNLADEKVIKKQLKYEFYDTLISMTIGWAINSAMIILAASAFFSQRIEVTELEQAQSLLTPLVGSHAAIIFAGALLLAGISSTVTSGIAGASIFTGFFSEGFQPKDIHTKIGLLCSLLPALLIVFFVGDAFRALILSQVLLSIQLPITLFTQIYLTSSKKVMGKYVNSKSTTVLLLSLGGIVTLLNIALLVSLAGYSI